MHLERKKGEPRVEWGQARISKERLAQVLAAARSAEGAVLGKRKQELFVRLAGDLFRDYDCSNSARSEALAWARADRLLAEAGAEFENPRRRKRAQQAHLAALNAFHKIIKTLGVKKQVLRRLAADSDDQYAAFESFLRKTFKATLSALMRRSGRNKRNEPAFYKSVGSVKPAVDVAVRASRGKAWRYFKQFQAGI
jgi:hypothetical protein